MVNKNMQLVYDTLLSIPGMNEMVRIDLKPSRKLVLLLQQVVERGLKAETGEGLVEAVPADDLTELRNLVASCLEKAGLTDVATKLKAIQQLK